MNIEIKEKERGKKVKKIIIGAYIDLPSYKKLQDEANESFTSVSSVTRKIIYNYLKNKEQQLKN